MKSATGYLVYVSHFLSKNNFFHDFSSYVTCHLWFPLLLYGWRTLCLYIYKLTGICVVCSLGFSSTIPLLMCEGSLFPYPSQTVPNIRYFITLPSMCECPCVLLSNPEDTGGTLCHHFLVYSLESGFIDHGGNQWRASPRCPLLRNPQTKVIGF